MLKDKNMISELVTLVDSIIEKNSYRLHLP